MSTPARLLAMLVLLLGLTGMAALTLVLGTTLLMAY